ncbi:hypothetical protein J4573_16285 [Actinomadura barringtoniae]|uniref:Uncharacterized protein n=1 Tax=Actinomadura barringtoniae TaxID=1427535 RepID=A0A939P9T7_9ACTN|nr:hypothetical protein [Actinomadura barringtoniae]MBO2448661.1 hypothetical protein [Actinomadura barringtoniae]
MLDEENAGQRLIEEMWPAVIAYTVAFTTQALGRPTERHPLTPVMQSLDDLDGHWAELGSTLDQSAVTDTLLAGIEVTAARCSENIPKPSLSLWAGGEGGR